ncbi:hypothetical protein [Allonocardiopsis opalescens]|uniref:Uncharacterized protein n=1 Tax=Allonocardiopsis opalescens TaxID=1144618 RepID=A0A2T0PP62_9ACTN|nr:hypothetical protein [Allonocardiopsis opalescens]PRX90695.1 hypothetical protein CLV72_11833 [Allonocardiopsis opalescens]
MNNIIPELSTDRTRCGVPCPNQEHTHDCDRSPLHLGYHRDARQKESETCDWPDRSDLRDSLLGFLSVELLDHDSAVEFFQALDQYVAAELAPLRVEIRRLQAIESDSMAKVRDFVRTMRLVHRTDQVCMYCATDDEWRDAISGDAPHPTLTVQVTQEMCPRHMHEGGESR